MIKWVCKSENYILQVLLPNTLLYDPFASGACLDPTTQVCLSTMLVLLIVQY